MAGTKRLIAGIIFIAVGVFVVYLYGIPNTLPKVYIPGFPFIP